MQRRLVSAIAAALLPAATAAQQPPAQPSDTARLPAALRIDRSREIALARTAAPAVVSDSAEIWILGDTGYEKAVDGTNGFGCIVQRGMNGQSLIPRCDDSSGVAAFFPIYRMLETMRLEGRTYGDYRKALADGFTSGKLREPMFGGFSYMYSVDAFFVTTAGRRVEFTPHVMVYWPNCKLSQLGMSKTEHMRGTALSFIDYGTPECMLIVNTPPATARRLEATP